MDHDTALLLSIGLGSTVVITTCVILLLLFFTDE